MLMPKVHFLKSEKKRYLTIFTLNSFIFQLI